MLRLCEANDSSRFEFCELGRVNWNGCLINKAQKAARKHFRCEHSRVFAFWFAKLRFFRSFDLAMRSGRNMSRSDIIMQDHKSIWVGGTSTTCSASSSDCFISFVHCERNQQPSSKTKRDLKFPWLTQFTRTGPASYSSLHFHRFVANSSSSSKDCLPIPPSPANANHAPSELDALPFLGLVFSLPPPC